MGRLFSSSEIESALHSELVRMEPSSRSKLQAHADDRVAFVLAWLVERRVVAQVAPLVLLVGRFLGVESEG